MYCRVVFNLALFLHVIIFSRARKFTSFHGDEHKIEWYVYGFDIIDMCITSETIAN